MRRTARIVPALSLALLLPFAPLAAQEASASLEITVRARADDRPLSGARISLDGIGMIALTDANGFARISSIPHGPRRVQVHFLGFAPMDERLVFEAGRPSRIEVRLDVEPIALREVRVRGRPSLLVRRGFYDRRRSGQGTFLTGDEIEAMQPRHLSDILRRIGGIQVGPPLFGVRTSAQMRGASARGSCPIQYYIDGILTVNFHIDDLLPADVEGMEIYRGAATVPAEFTKGTALCGLILIWTKGG